MRKQLSFNTAIAVLTSSPNPVKDFLFVQSTPAFSNKLQVTLNNVSGKTYNISFKRTDINKISVDLSALPAGIYFLQVIDETGNRRIEKIIKQ